MASASGRSEGKKKGDCVLLCELSSLQSTLYTVLTEMETFRLVSGSQEPCTCDSGEPQGYCCRVSNKKGQPWFELVAYCTVLLLKCANHVGLLLSSRDCDDQVQRCLQKTFRRHSELLGLSSAASFLTLSSTQYCGKLKVLEKLLPRLKIKARKIVFYTHSHQMVVALEEFFMSLKYSYIKMDSTVSLLSRQKMVERFREQTTTEFILLCSTEYVCTVCLVTYVHAYIVV
jgi:SNF2 family DNA or RNA helicase